MDTAEIDYQPPVDEHPHVVVPREAQGAGTVIRKSGVDFRAKVVVVAVALISKPLVIDREKGVVEVVKLLRVVLHERDGLARDDLVDPGDGVEPLVESAAGWNKVACRPAGHATALWLAVRAQVVLDQPALDREGATALEVRVRFAEVIDRDVERKDRRWCRWWRGRHWWRRMRGRWRGRGRWRRR